MGGREVRGSAAEASHRALVGVLSAVGAYAIWGFAALYWPLVGPVSPFEILAHRVVWTVVVCLILLPVVHGWGDVGRAIRQPRLLGMLGMAAVLISINWGTFIWAVTNGEVLQSSLGYFINPILSILLGVVILRERLRVAQWVAVVLGVLAMTVLIIGFGGVPVVSLALALSFTGYGFIKKQANLNSIASLAIESSLMLPVALLFLAWSWTSGGLSFGQDLGQSLLLMGGGVITAAPLLLFGVAAIRIPLSTLGILQYLGPLLQFVLALVVFGELMSPARWTGFILVWLALAVFSWDLIRHTTRRPELAGVPESN